MKHINEFLQSVAVVLIAFALFIAVLAVALR
jgi:hypothetical protein